MKKTLLTLSATFILALAIAKPPPPPPSYTYTFTAQDTCGVYPHPCTLAIGPGDGWLAENGGTPPPTFDISNGDQIRIGFAGCTDTTESWLAGYVTRYVNGSPDQHSDLMLPAGASSGVWQLQVSGTNFSATLVSYEPVQN